MKWLSCMAVNYCLTNRYKVIFDWPSVRLHGTIVNVFKTISRSVHISSRWFQWEEVRNRDNQNITRTSQPCLINISRAHTHTNTRVGAYVHKQLRTFCFKTQTWKVIGYDARMIIYPEEQSSVFVDERHVMPIKGFLKTQMPIIFVCVSLLRKKNFIYIVPPGIARTHAKHTGTRAHTQTDTHTIRRAGGLTSLRVHTMALRTLLVWRASRKDLSSAL